MNLTSGHRQGEDIGKLDHLGKWIEAKVVFEQDSCSIAGDLTANIFHEMGLQGVRLDEPGLEPDEGWAEEAEKEPDHFAVSGYFPLNESFEKKRLTLENQVARLESKISIKARIVYTQIDEEDWAESWKQYFLPEKISDRIVVKPTWRSHAPEKGEIVIELDPGMAFGTGAHATTSLCVSMIEKYLKHGDSFLDVGTGSGILMIAAALLGAGKVRGVDNDEVAVEIAENNLNQNKIDQKKFKVSQGDLVCGIHEKFNFITANIISEVILVLLEDIHKVMKDDCILVCSGINEKNAEHVLDKMKKLGFNVIETAFKEKWTSIAVRKNI